MNSAPTTPPSMPPDWANAVRSYTRFWINLARSSALGEEEARDVVQTVVASALEQKGKKFESLEHIRNYVARGVLNRSIQWRQRGERMTPMTDQIESSLGSLDETDYDLVLRRRMLREGLLRLPRRDFEVVKLRFFTGLTFQEISDMKGVAVSTLKSREESAMKKIRAWFRKNGIDNVI
jgi:RNA polymerase sigma factor (sigma-70 family)